MFKKIACFAFCIIIIVGVWLTSATPIFANYSNTYELYIGSSSSNAKIVSAGIKEYPFIKNVKGESCIVDCTVENVISDFNAVVIFTEQTAEGVSYYAYSKDLKKSKILRGEEINLHVFVGKDYVKVGSPIIFGSF